MIKYKAFSTPCLLAGTLLFSVQSQAQDFSQQARDVTIMSGIFQTVLQEESNQNAPVFSGGNSFYLAEQGMLFRFSLNSAEDFTFFSRLVSERTSAFIDLEAPGALIADSFIPFNRSRGNGFPTGGAELGGLRIMTGAGRPTGANTELQTAAQALMEQRIKVQDVQVDIRNTQTQMNENPENTLDEQLATLTSQLDKLRTSLDEQRAKMEELSNVEQARVEAEHQAKAQQMLTSLTNTLCDYGTTLRSLADDEHVTLVLENFNQNSDTTRMMVFDGREVKNCSSVESLLGDATIYEL